MFQRKEIKKGTPAPHQNSKAVKRIVDLGNLEKQVRLLVEQLPAEDPL
jgi:hypothetical protein